MAKWLAAVLAVAFLSHAALAADEYRVEAAKEAPPGQVSPAIAQNISPTGYKVVDGGNRVVCEIWPAKLWAAKADFQPSLSVTYPFEIGSLMGVLRFTRKGADFRGQDIPHGVYTLRYANQPEDGNHVGTFETRDFLVMLPASVDQSPKAIAEMDLFKLSAQSAGSTHPAIMPLVKPEEGESPSVRHIEDKEWWTLRLADGKGGKQALEVVVVGKVAE